MKYTGKPKVIPEQKTISTETYIERARGRALSNLTKDIKDELVEHIGSGKSLYQYSHEKNIPEAQIHSWLYYDDELRKQIEFAQETSHLLRFEEIESLADEALKKVTELRKEKDLQKFAQVLLNAYDLKISTKKWTLSKINPRRYSEKMDITSGGKAIGGNTIVFADFNAESPKVDLQQNEKGEYETSS